jgi:hypothetical protein
LPVQHFTLESEANQKKSFNVVKNTAETYSFDINRLTGQFTVTEETALPITYPIWGGGTGTTTAITIPLVAAAVIAIVADFLLKKHKA